MNLNKYFRKITRNTCFYKMSNELTSYSYKISTITMSISNNKNILLNLIDIGKYLKIDESIVGIKYNYGKDSILKGIYETTNYKKSKNKKNEKINKRLFYNQVSLIINYNSHNINVKLFNNGSLHLTGIKDPSEGKKIASLIFNKLKHLNIINDKILLTLDENDVYIDNNNLIYGKYNSIFRVFGFKYTNEDGIVFYNIKNKDYYIQKINNKNHFISKTLELKRTKQILDLNGYNVGIYRVELLKNKNKLYTKNSNIKYDLENQIIYYENKNKNIINIIGKIVYEIKENNYEEERNEVLEINYIPNILEDEKDNNFVNEEDLIDDINSINITFNLPYCLNRQRLFNELINMKYICEFKPEKYSGMKFVYKQKQSRLNDYKFKGLCVCNNKCTCNNITFLIFQSGNIITTGLKNLDDIENILLNFKTIIEPIQDNIKKRELI